MKLLSFLFGKRTTPFELEVKFHKEANHFGEHGTIVVSHAKHLLSEQPVRFVFVGMTTPPKMTLALLNYLWEEARFQGYVPHHIETYGRENEIRTPAVVSATVTNLHAA